MELKLFFLLISSVLYFGQIVNSQESSKRLVCFYDVTTGKYQGEPFRFPEKHLPKALADCTHLVYSFAEILPKTLKLKKFIVNPNPSTIKSKFPHLKVLLSVGGDNPALTDQYLKFLEADELQHNYFAKHIKKLLQIFKFDGLDLAFPLPRNAPHKVQSQFDNAVMKIKSIFTGEKVVDDKAVSHKLQYTKFVNNLKNQFSKANLKLSMTVLPNVNSSLYFDIFKIHKNFEFINLFAFDFLTPAQNPAEADYTAPIYYKGELNRYPYNTIDFQVNHWINNGCPVNQLNLGIATYGRAWKLTIDSGLSGKPIVENTNGAADPGRYSKLPGLLSSPEICVKLATKIEMLQKIVDKELKYGNYAFRPADKNNKNGLWISFDDSHFAGIKTDYVLKKGMGGITIYNLQNDDFLKLCGGPLFPILRRVSKGLGVSQQIHEFYEQTEKLSLKHQEKYWHDNLVK